MSSIDFCALCGDAYCLNCDYDYECEDDNCAESFCSKGCLAEHMADNHKDEEEDEPCAACIGGHPEGCFC